MIWFLALGLGLAVATVIGHALAERSMRGKVRYRFPNEEEGWREL